MSKLHRGREARIERKFELKGVYSFDCDCLAGDTEVLTDSGWQQIANINASDKVWDGVEWVNHDGVVSKGVQPVMVLNGVRLTPDHLILIGGQWVPARDANHNDAATDYQGPNPCEPMLYSRNESGDYESEVFDLVNAGPRSRFTIRGFDARPFIVHNCDCAAAPNYQPVADASAEAARISAALGQQQLDEARYQYDKNLEVSKPIVDAQLDLMKQTKLQGDDYYNYMKSKQRPVEDALNAEALAGESAADVAERNLITGGNSAVYNARKVDIDADVQRSLADLNQQTGRAIAQSNRNMLSMGVNPNSGKFASANRAASMAHAANTANTANAQRNASTDQARGLIAKGRDLRMQDKAQNWAKKLDVAGLYRGLPGASQGAYSLANQSGNSAMQNQMAPGAQLQNGMAQGAGTTMNGLGLQVQGLGSVLSAQTNYANSVNQAMNSGDGGLGGLGSLLGGAAAVYTA